MINIIAIILCATLLTIALPQISFKQQNAIDALALDNQKASNTIGQACQGSDVICVGAGLGQCSNGVIVSLGACGSPLSCQVLPLVNKPGTSVACTTEQDKLDRIKANQGTLARVVTSPVAPIDPVPEPSEETSDISPPPTITPTEAQKAGDFVCVDDTTFMHFISSTGFVLEKCPPGFCATRTPPSKNPCVGKANADRIDKV